MKAADRIVERLLDSDVPLRRSELARAAAELVPEEAPLAGPGIVADVVDALVGLGPIERLLRQPEVTDVLVNGPSDVWVERAGSLQPAPVSFPDDEAIFAAIERVVAEI